MDRLTPADLQLLQSAVSAVRQAEATHQFVARHLSTVYGIEGQANVDLATGEIRRPQPLEGVKLEA